MDIQIFVDLCCTVVLSVICCILISVIYLLYLRSYFHQLKQKNRKSKTVAFFHPYCNSGGGGERVLWFAVQALQRKYPSLKVIIYTGDVDASPQDILMKTEQRFNIMLINIEFKYLHKRYLIEASRYPYFTLLCQSIGSMKLGYEALKLFIPDVYIDTTGCSFTLPIFSFLAGCHTISYVHYPTITTEMMTTVKSRRELYNNRGIIARNLFLSRGKLIYYRIFAFLYKCVGRFSDIIMVNSTWTEDHINSVWDCPMNTYKVYPPCDTKDLQSIPLERSSDGKVKILSIGQFRKEKDHPLQVKALYKLRLLVPEDVWDMIELVFIGSTRNEEDEEWLQDIKDLCKHYSVENNVSFKVNVSYSALKQELAEGLIGIHTMWNEHFGISIVECMAAGLIMIAHKSGGPMLDIIEESNSSRNGFLAEDEDEFARFIAVILVLSEENRNRIKEAARSSTNRFSVEEFQVNFLRAVESLLS